MLPELNLSNLRLELDLQLEQEGRVGSVPSDFLFVRNVGRHFTVVSLQFWNMVFGPYWNMVFWSILEHGVGRYGFVEHTVLEHGVVRHGVLRHLHLLIVSPAAGGRHGICSLGNHATTIGHKESKESKESINTRKPAGYN